MGAKQKAKVYLLIASLQAVMVAFLMFWAGSSSTVSAATGINSQLSFEGKIVKSDGTNITNGTYNMEFKIYQDGTNTGSGSTLKWTEDRLVGGSGGVTLTDGTFQVNLGSVNPFGSQVDWNQDTLWLSMQIGNSSSCTISITFQSNCGGDGEMTPYIRLTAVPYANNAAALGGIAASGFIQSGTSPQTANFNVVSGSSGSVTATIQGASGQSVDIAEIKVNGVSNPVFKVASDGSTTVQSPNAQGSLTAMQIQNSTGASLLTADTTNMRLGVNVTYTAMSAPTQNPLNYSPTGGSLSGSVYYYRVTAIDAAGGETLPSAEKAISGLTGTTNQITVSWSAVTGATAYRVYRADSSFSETYLATTSNTSFIDTGSVTLGTATYPSTNTAYISTNNSNSSLQLTVGGLGTPTGQAYISGTQPMFRGQNTDSKLSGANNVYVQGRYAYVANYNNNKLDIYDVSNPANPSFVGENSDSNLSTPSSVQVQGRYAYVISTGNNKLEVYDVSNPSAPTYVAATAGYDYASSPLAVYVQGRYAYVVSYSNSLLIAYDISNPYNITYLSAIGSGISYPNSIYIAGKYAYVTNAVTNKLAVCNISNPSSMSCVTNSDSNLSSPNAVYVQGRYAYVSSMSSNKLKIYDVSNPLSPTYLSQNSDSNLSSPNAVYVQGRYAYVVSSGNSKLEVYDVSNPSAPTYVTQNADSKMSSPQGVYIQGRYAYVIGGSKLSSYDLGGTYTQQLEAGGTETGTLQVNAGGQVNGDFNIGGALQVSQNIQTSGDMGVVGAVNITGNVTIGGETSQLAIPSAPTVTPQGTTGFQRWDYQITAVDSYGDESPASLSGTTSSGNSTLTVSNYNTISWSSVSGAASYNIYRTYATGGNPSSKGYIGSTTSTTFNDTGSNGVGSLTNPPQFKVNGQAWFRVKTDSGSAFQIQGASTSTLFTANSVTRTAGTTGNMIKIGNSSGTDTTTTVLQLASSNGNLTTNLTSLNGGLYYNSSTNHVNVIENGAVKELCNKTDLSCGATPTLASSYNSASTTGNTITLAQFGAGVKIQDAPTPITGSDLFDVQSNGGATTYLGVSPANSGTVTVGGRLYTPSLDSTSGTLNIGTGNASTITIGNTSNSNVVIKTAPTALTSVYNENFDSGGTWTNGGTTNGVYTWSARSQTTAQSGSTYWAYNNGTSDGYDTGGAINYYSNSPAFDISARTNPILNMYYQLNLAEIGTTYDQAFIEIVDATNPNITRASWPLTTNQLTWTLFNKSLTPSWGSVKIQVRIYTSDGTINTGFGFRVDSVSVSDNAPPAFQVQNATGNYLLAVDSQSSNVITTNLAAQSAGTVSLNDSQQVSNSITSTATQGTATTIGLDGYARIAYVDSYGYVDFIRCTNANCSSKSTTNNIAFATYYDYAALSIAMGSDGFARIAYYDSSSGADILKLIQCTNTDCSTKVITTVDPNGHVGQYNSIAMGSDGFARIAYYDSTNQDLKYAQCTNATCSTNVITLIDSTGNVGSSSHIVLGSDGYPRISYYDTTNKSLKYAQCTNDSCSTSILTTVATTYASWSYSSVTMGSDGYARLVYQGPSGYVQYARCTNATCSTSVVNTLTSTAPSQYPSSLNIVTGSNGYARISYYTGNYISDEHLYLIQCLDNDCSTTSASVLDSSGNDGSQASMVISLGDWINISYFDYTNNVLKFAHIVSTAPLGTSVVSGSSVGTTASPYGQIYAKAIDLGTFSVNGTGFTVLKPLYDSSSLLQIQNTSGTNILSVDSVNKRVNLLAAAPITPSSVTISSSSTIIDNSGGYNISNVIAPDGYNRIVQVGNGLRYYQCTSSDCTSKISTTIATFSCGSTDQSASMGIAPDGFARVAYMDCNNPSSYGLKYIQCQNISCSTRATYSVDTVSVSAPKLVIAPDGFARITYFDSTNLDLKYAQCTDAACSTPVITTIDSAGDVGRYPSITLGSDGFARIAYEDYTNSALKMVQCTNASCSTNVITSVATAPYNTGWSTGIAMGTSGFPEISYYYSSSADLKLIACTSASCSSSTSYTVDSTNTVGQYNALTIDSSGTLYISYYNATDGVIKLATVTSSFTISTYVINSASGTGFGYPYSAVTVGSDGKARIAYQDLGTSKLRFTVQGSSTASTIGSDLGISTNRFANLYATNVNSNYLKIQPAIDITSAFQIQNSSGSQIFNVDTSNSIITLGTSSDNVTISSSSGLTLNGSARHQKNISLTAEYPGAVMTATSGNGHSGSMTSDFDITNFQNYYDWTSTTAGNDYDIFVRVPIPDDFSAWNGIGTVRVWGTAATTSVTIAVYDSANTSICTSGNLISAVATWQTSSSCDYTASGTWTAGGTLTLRLRLTATSANDHARVSNIKLPYYGKW